MHNVIYCCHGASLGLAVFIHTIITHTHGHTLANKSTRSLTFRLGMAHRWCMAFLFKLCVALRTHGCKAFGTELALEISTLGLQ